MPQKEIVYIKELLEKDVDYIKKTLDHMNDHLAKLNGQVTKNTEFRISAKGMIALVGFVATTFGGVVTYIATRLWR